MKSTLIIVIVVGVFALALLLALVYRNKKTSVYVFGEEMARATEAEQQRKLKGDAGKSSMPGGEYDFWRGEHSLIRPVKNSLDSTLNELCRGFAKSDEQARAHARSSISLEEFYTLITFSGRASVFALRERDAEWAVNGLTALAMIEADRTDYRDILVALSLLYHSAKRIGENPDQLLRDAASLSEPGVSRLMMGFIQRPPREKELRSSWGHDEVETADGLGFIGWGFKEYNPTYDLKKTVLEISDLIAADKYQPGAVSVAAELPDYWLKSNDNTALDKALKAIRAGASISANLRPNEHPDHKSQRLMVFLVEAADESTARTLMDLSKKKQASSYHLLGLAKERLFCLVVARSFVEGVESFETAESLARFSGGIDNILSHSAGKR